MRIGHVDGARPQWYRVAPSVTRLSYVYNSVAPHGPTTRASYTVPSGRTAYIMCSGAMVARESAATTPGNVQALVRLDAVVGPGVTFASNTVGEHAELAQGESGILGSGKSVEIVTSDFSTGGTMDYIVYVHVAAYN